VQKISFMDQHSIEISVISLANPWLDFLTASDAPEAARQINDDIDSMCERYPARLFAFGTLPVSAGAEACVREVRRLDDARMERVWTVLEEVGLPVFLHPHYGLPKEVYGPRADEYGHVLPLAMG
jgi:predicted TIM-barrel fold metal-dependent hydrolase